MSNSRFNNTEITELLSLVTAITRRYIKSEELAEDLVQDIMIKLLANVSLEPRFKNAWLATVVRNSVFDYLRKEKRRNKVIAIDSVDTSGVCAESTGEDTKVDDQESHIEPDLLEKLRSVVAGLPIKQRTALVMHAYGFTYEEIAARTTSNVGTVRSRLHHAKKKAKLFLLPYV